MVTVLRNAALAVLAGGLAVAAQLTVAGPAGAVSAPAITIAATAKLGPVTGDVLVFYRTGAFATAKVHGTIAGAAVGDVAALYGQEFPFKKPAVRLGSLTLKSAKASYSFTVTPPLATKYAVRLFASGSAGAPVLATSPVKIVYVTPGGTVSGGANCTRPVCHETFHTFILLPSSALSTEMSKHLYPYFGLSLSPTSEPPPPAWDYLNAGHASVSKPRKINSGEFEQTVTFTFTIGNDGYFWAWTACTRDSLTKDGLGLPGRHGCGDSRVRSNVTYLG